MGPSKFPAPGNLAFGAMNTGMGRFHHCHGRRLECPDGQLGWLGTRRAIQGVVLVPHLEKTDQIHPLIGIENTVSPCGSVRDSTSDSRVWRIRHTLKFPSNFGKDAFNNTLNDMVKNVRDPNSQRSLVIAVTLAGGAKR